MANMIAGMNIVVVKPPAPVKRNWRERFFSRPWRPWRATRMVEHPMWALVNGKECWQYGNTLFVNEQQLSVLRRDAGYTDFM